MLRLLSQYFSPSDSDNAVTRLNEVPVGFLQKLCFLSHINNAVVLGKIALFNYDHIRTLLPSKLGNT